MVAAIARTAVGAALTLVLAADIAARLRRESDDRAKAERLARMRSKPGPSAREKEWAMIRARQAELRADVDAGRIAPMAERCRP